MLSCAPFGSPLKHLWYGRRVHVQGYTFANHGPPLCWIRMTAAEVHYFLLLDRLLRCFFRLEYGKDTITVCPSPDSRPSPSRILVHWNRSRMKRRRLVPLPPYPSDQTATKNRRRGFLGGTSKQPLTLKHTRPWFRFYCECN